MEAVRLTFRKGHGYRLVQMYDRAEAFFFCENFRKNFQLRDVCTFRSLLFFL